MYIRDVIKTILKGDVSYPMKNQNEFINNCLSKPISKIWMDSIEVPTKYELVNKNFKYLTNFL